MECLNILELAVMVVPQWSLDGCYLFGVRILCGISPCWLSELRHDYGIGHNKNLMTMSNKMGKSLINILVCS